MSHVILDHLNHKTRTTLEIASHRSDNVTDGLQQIPYCS
jgi:hypothetical protein